MINQVISFPSKDVEIIKGDGIVNNKWSFLDHQKNYVLITDQNIFSLYQTLLDTIPNKLTQFITKPGEDSKSIETYQSIIEHLLKFNIDRNTILIAFGGGVITDLSAFVAGTYKRGISFINIPTTLIGMVDASIGGKCGINLNNFKNQIGLFNHPSKIIIDPNLLKTLPSKEFNNGMAEIIKCGIIESPELFMSIENNDFCINQIIEEALKVKIKLVLNDEFDKKERKKLNFGHTYGHLLESFTNYNISHGEAVALGMIKETSNLKIKNRLINILQRYFDLENLFSYHISKEIINKYLLNDKKISSANQPTCEVIEITEIGSSQIISKKVEDLINEYLR